MMGTLYNELYIEFYFLKSDFIVYYMEALYNKVIYKELIF